MIMEATIYQVEDFIEHIRDCVPNAIEVFTKGNCTSFAILLAKAIPGGKVLHNLDHAVYEYNGHCYDITGEVPKPKNAIPIEEYGIIQIVSLLRNNYKAENAYFLNKNNLKETYEN